MAGRRVPLPPVSLEEYELAWVAGVVSVMGEMKIPHRGKPRIQLLLSSARHQDAVERAAIAAGTHTILMANKITLKLQGYDLDDFIDLLWPYLTEARRLEYNRLCEMQASKMNDLAKERRQRESDRLYFVNKHKPTRDERREYLETHYDNHDPAVQVIRDSDELKPSEVEIQLAQLARDQELARQRADMPYLDYSGHAKKPKRKKKTNG